MRNRHVTILTDRRYVNPEENSAYIRNILLEDRLVRAALEENGLRVERLSWDDPDTDWGDTEYILFRSTWDYFDRFPEFSAWLETVHGKTRMINPYKIIRWNLDKHYLQELSESGINIPPTRFIEQGNRDTLTRWVKRSGWKEIILKPVVSGAARHTYRFHSGESLKFEPVFRKLIRQESMMIQEFQEKVPEAGEVAFMLIGGRFTHAVIKRARSGDFRVQDDFGGTVHPYHPDKGEIDFAEKVIGQTGHNPTYARVDAIWDNRGEMAVSELELIEPELWFRYFPRAAELLAKEIMDKYF